MQMLYNSLLCLYCLYSGNRAGRRQKLLYDFSRSSSGTALVKKICYRLIQVFYLSGHMSRLCHTISLLSSITWVSRTKACCLQADAEIQTAGRRLTKQIICRRHMILEKISTRSNRNAIPLQYPLTHKIPISYNPRIFPCSSPAAYAEAAYCPRL